MKLRLLSGLALPGLLLSGLAAAQSPVAAPQAPSSADEVFVDGVKVAIDPKTHRIRPMTQAESKALSDAMRNRPAMAAPAGLRGSSQPRTLAESMSRAHTLKNGTKLIRVPTSMMNDISVTIGADGKPQYTESMPDALPQTSTVQPEAVQ